MSESLIKTIVSKRFAKFCTVGASGVVVNLSILALFSDFLKMNINMASALAILVSINTNFFINEAWTFKDRVSEKKGLFARWLRFHFVSAIGALVQWSLFIVFNFVWLWLIDDEDLGYYKYLSQLIGIGVATLWNFLANFHWTWKRHKER